MAGGIIVFVRIEILKRALASSDLDDVRRAAEIISRLGNEELLSFLRHEFSQSRGFPFKSAVALGMRYEPTPSMMMPLLNAAGEFAPVSRASVFLYALAHYDCSEVLAQIAEFFFTTNYEQLSHCVMIVEALPAESAAGSDPRREAIAILKNGIAAYGPDTDTHQAMKHALAVLGAE